MLSKVTEKSYFAPKCEIYRVVDLMTHSSLEGQGKYECILSDRKALIVCKFGYLFTATEEFAPNLKRTRSSRASGGI